LSQLQGGRFGSPYSSHVTHSRYIDISTIGVTIMQRDDPSTAVLLVTV